MKCEKCGICDGSPDYEHVSSVSVSSTSGLCAALCLPCIREWVGVLMSDARFQSYRTDEEWLRFMRTQRVWYEHDISLPTGVCDAIARLLDAERHFTLVFMQWLAEKPEEKNHDYHMRTM